MSIPVLLRLQNPPARKKENWEETAEVLGKIGDAVKRADLDFYNVPFNRNVVGNPAVNPGLVRFSEYHPKKRGYPKPSVLIPRGTYGRAHVEIRPIRGRGESLLTRFTLDYRGGEIFSILPKPLRPLEIDCFTALTPPTIAYDRRFTQRDKSVVKIGKDGSVRYQNACREGKLATPFYSSAAPPPKIGKGKNPDWMFYFQPLRTSLRDHILERYINRRVGALWLWASNPTYGFTDPAHYEKFSIRYNTWPRRLGDLLRFFGPWLDAAARENLRQNAPFLNPNSEYLDENGKRQWIPEDPDALLRLNERRKKLGLPAVPRPRGAPVDWTFSDLIRDPERLAATPLDRLPYIQGRFQFEPETVLEIPNWGNFRIDAKTDLHVSYRVQPQRVFHGGKWETRARTELAVSFQPLELDALELNLAGFRFRAGKLSAKRVEWILPFRSVYSPKKKTWVLQPQWDQVSLLLAGVSAKGVQLENAANQVRISLGEVRLDYLRYQGIAEVIHASLRGFAARDLKIDSAFGQLVIPSAKIGKGRLKASPDFSRIEARIPKIVSSGRLWFKPRNFPASKIEIVGTKILEKIAFVRELRGDRVASELELEWSGKVERAVAANPIWGKVTLSSREGNGSHALRGHFRGKMERPLAEGEKGQVEYEAGLQIPFMTFHLDRPNVIMREGSSFLRDGEAQISQDRLLLSGDWNLEIDEVKNLPGTDVLRWQNLEVFPHLEDMHLRGPAELEYSSNRFHLQRRAASSEPIELGFTLTDSHFVHIPFDEEYLAKNPEKRVIRSDLKIAHAQVSATDIREVEYRVLEKDGKTRAQLARLESGPIMVHHVQGGGEIWVNTGLWSWLRGRFPHFGIPLEEIPRENRTARPRSQDRPDPSDWVGELDPKVQAALWDEKLGDYGNFVRIGTLSVGSDPKAEGGSRTQIEDLLLYAHETGHFWQFAAVRVPKILLRQSLDARGKVQLRVEAGEKKTFLHIFLKEPKRGYNRFEVKSVR